MWKRAAGAVLLLAASAALASEAPSGAPSACEAADVARLASGLHGLSERVSALEREVERLEARLPTAEERESAEIAQERRAEFLRHVWTDG